MHSSLDPERLQSYIISKTAGLIRQFRENVALRRCNLQTQRTYLTSTVIACTGHLLVIVSPSASFLGSLDSLYLQAAHTMLGSSGFPAIAATVETGIPSAAAACVKARMGFLLGAVASDVRAADLMRVLAAESTQSWMSGAPRKRSWLTPFYGLLAILGFDREWRAPITRRVLPV